jgi:tripartite-type tricarboxylate transporter receptor subunit TctC
MTELLFRVFKNPRSYWGHAMTLHRRQFLHLAVGGVALPAFSHSAWAQAYPARPVHLIVAFPTGSAPDIIARLAGQHLSECRSALASNS